MASVLSHSNNINWGLLDYLELMSK